MIKKSRICVCGIFFSMMLTLSACSVEELLTQVPKDMQLNEVPRQILEQMMPEATDETAESADADAVPSEEEPAEKITFLDEHAGDYAYNSLSSAEKLWYENIEQALGSMEETVRLSEEGLAAGLNENNIDLIFQCVLMDHPELFYVTGYTYTQYARGDRLVAISFSGKYELTSEEANLRKVQIEQAAEEMLQGIDSNASDYDKVKYVYDTIITSTEYDLSAPDNQNIYSVFVGRRSVCQGYAKAAQYLLNRLGVECIMLQGSVYTGESHAWNIVRVDGRFYHVDVTWGDVSYLMESDQAVAAVQVSEVNYDYLCITTEQLLKTHSLDNIVPVPECVDTAANYYVRENALFETYDRDKLGQLFQRALEKGQNEVNLKCTDEGVYWEIKTDLIDNQAIFDYLSDDSGTISYANNDKQLSMSFWMTN